MKQIDLSNNFITLCKKSEDTAEYIPIFFQYDNIIISIQFPKLTKFSGGRINEKYK